MTVECLAPDLELGVALRLATYLDCQSRALGENGFQALAGGPVISGILSGLITIFVALIGYRMILGGASSVREGVGWAMRLGVVLALVTSWPAFQTVIYRVVTEGPREVAGIILPAVGLSTDSMDERIQGVYDRIRLGISGEGVPANAAIPQPLTSDAIIGAATAPRLAVGVLGVPPLPHTASLFVVSTVGLMAAARVTIGFLAAIGPMAVLCLLFQGTTSIFDGWLRALVGAAFAVLAVTITSALELVAIEFELAHEAAVRSGDTVGSYDPQALVTIVLMFIAVTLGSMFAGMRVASAFRLPVASAPRARSLSEVSLRRSGLASDDAHNLRGLAAPASPSTTARDRTTAVAEALSAAAYRDQGLRTETAPSGVRQMTTTQESSGITALPPLPLGIAGRRSTGRLSRSARRRDISA